MEFGCHLPVYGAAATRETLLAFARRMEALGYDSLWASDHVVIPWRITSKYPYNETGDFPLPPTAAFLEPLTALALVAGATERIRLGTTVLVLPHRHPVLAAKMLATLDHLAPGRVILGAGVGWLREEFDALAAPAFEARGAVTDEYLRLMRATWTVDPVTFEGKHYRVRDVHALPKPAQRGGIPIWIGGHTDGALKRAGTLGDAWHPIGLRPPAMLLPDEYAQKVKQIHAWAQRAGREPSAIRLTLRAPMEVRPKGTKAGGGSRPLLQGTAAEVAADLQQYVALGVSHFVFDPTVPDVKAVLANLERFADEVRPKLKRVRA